MPTVNYIEKLYSLEDYSVKDIEILPDYFLIYIEFQRKSHTCPSCKNSTSKIKDYRTQKIKIDDINGKPSFALVNKRRYICPHCNKTFYERTAIAEKYQRRSPTQILNIIQECSKKQSFKDISLRYKVSLTTVIRYFSLISFPVPNHLPDVISIDEFKGNAQGQKYQVALVDPVNKKPLDILPKRDTNELISYFYSNFTYEQRCKVRLVVTDLSSLFKKVITTVFPYAKIIADRYHVFRLVTWAMERVRKRVQNTLHAERIYFKRSKFLINKNINNLSKDELIKLEDLLSKSKDLGYAYLLKESFKRVLREGPLTVRRVLSAWLELVKVSGLQEFKSILTTFSRWNDEIVRSFISKHSNGYIEGHNNKIKVLKRISFGIKNFDILRNRILFAS